MEGFTDFMSAALPWIATGLLLAIFFARAVHGKKGKKAEENYGSDGMALGMCFGVAMGTALHFDIGLGMMAGMLLGLLIGSGMKKEDNHSAHHD
ncbi:MAG: hypothetical protein E7474_05220 [Ruminococcaceae bacterium]|nr:hypothetical protein [Oscillospiraceae bacterium]